MQNSTIDELIINPEEIVYLSTDELWIGVAKKEYYYDCEILQNILQNVCRETNKPRRELTQVIVFKINVNQRLENLGFGLENHYTFYCSKN